MASAARRRTSPRPRRRSRCPKWRRPRSPFLPFTNMSGDPEQEYFSDGISDDIITDLSKIAGLTVIARNSSFTYKGRSVDIRTVGRELGVQSVLEGSIRRAGNRVRITAQLIDTTNGGHLWADRYDRDLTDIFEVQDDVTHRIVDALKITLSPAEKERLADTATSKHPTSSPTIACCAAANSCSARKRTSKRSNKRSSTSRRRWNTIPTTRWPMSASASATCSITKTAGPKIPTARCQIAKEYARQAIEKGPERTAGAMRIRIGGVVRKGSRSRQDRNRCRP